MYETKEAHFRDRCEFRIWHDDKKTSYAMNGSDKKSIVCIDECQIVSTNIFDMMPKLLNEIVKNSILKQKLFAIEFLSSQSSKEVLATLIYHKKLDESWMEEAKSLKNIQNLKIIGRSRKTKIVLDEDFITEKLNIQNQNFIYKRYEGAFSQPNGLMNEKMLNWVCSNISKVSSDLLELYCGNGNFTLPMSKKFNKVLATEISKTSIKSAKENCILNDITNINFVRMSSQEITTALNKQREFNRLKEIDLDNYNFSHVFVDPPRSGLDEESLKLVSRFDNIIYISCNQETLHRDLLFLTKSHEIKKFAIFDQFAHTNHIESGVILRVKQ